MLLLLNAYGKPGRLSIRYDGPDVESLPIRDLAPALIGINEVLEEIEAISSPDPASRVEVRVRAGFEKGSFEADLEILRFVHGEFVSLFNSPTATAWATFFGLLGISGVAGLIQFMRRAKGREPRRVVEITKSTKVRVEFDRDDSIEVERDVVRLFNSPKVRGGIAKVVKPLEAKSASVLHIRQPDVPAEVITADEVPSFILPPKHEGEFVTESERVVRLVSVSFKAGNKWRVSEGGQSFNVSILDPAFTVKVVEGDESFAANTCLKVLLRTRQWRQGAVLKSAYEIIKVIEVIDDSSATQTTLPLG